MKVIKGDKLRYGRNAHIPENLVIGTGVFIIVVVIIGFINSILSDNLASKTIVSSMFFIIIGLVILLSGIKLKLKLKAYVDKFLYIKEKGKKAEGKIKKGYSYVQSINEDGVRHEMPYYQLKISYLDELTSKIGTFITPPLPGDINKICSDKVDVYYYDGEAVFDNLIENEKETNYKFEEGIHIGSPLTDNDEWKSIEKLSIKERLKETNRLRKEIKKKSRSLNYNIVSYEEEK